MELMVAATLTAVVFGVAIPLLTGQSRTIASSAGRLDAQQNARYAQNALDRELRMVGVNTLGTQPMIVQADARAVTFNSDLTTRDAADAWSIYYDADADSTTTLAMQTPGIAMPVTGFVYPSVNMLDRDGLPGRAETISYWVSADSSSPRPNEYILWRKANRADPVVVASGIYLASGQPFFQYIWAKDSTGVLDTVPAARLPLKHLASTHGSPADTGETATIAAQVDRVRSVVVRVAAQFRDAKPGAPLGRRMVRNTTSLVNMTMLNRPSCGLAPDPVSVSVNVTYNNGQPDKATLTWSHASDDLGGERDVERYLLYRSENGAPWGEPFDEVPAGSTNYSYADSDVKRPPTAAHPWFNNFQYAVVVQDCQPQLSALGTSATLPILVIP
jgi:hypothetical protein